MRPRLSSDVLGERVASLETESYAHGVKIAAHDTRLTDHSAILNQVKGGIRLLVVLWTIAVAVLGARELFPRHAGASAPTSVSR